MAQGQLVVYFYEHVDVLGDTLHSGVAAKTPAESFRSLGFSFLGDAGPTFIVVVVRAFVFHQVSQGHSAKQKNRQEAQQPKRGATNRPRGADASVGFRRLLGCRALSILFLGGFGFMEGLASFRK